MDRRVLVDSSALVAHFLRRDQNHRHARRAFRELIRGRVALIVPEFVVGEVATHFKRRAYDACRTFLTRLKGWNDAGVMALAIPDEEEVTDASSVVLELPDPDFTYFDALLVTMARRRGIRRVFSFDRAFATLGLPSV